MKRQELCQLLEFELASNFNKLEIKNICNYCWVSISGNDKLMKLTPEQIIQEAEFMSYLQKLKSGIPVQYVFNTSCFYGIDLEVNSDVLIPRSETEELVSWILNDYKLSKPIHVLDIGTGSGCISIALKKHKPDWKVTAIDISERALELARRNALKYQLEIDFIQTDFIKSKNELKDSYDLIVSNPPYVSRNELHLLDKTVLEHEPAIALFPNGEDPFIFYKEIAAWASQHLKNTAALYFELNEFFADEIRTIFLNSGFGNVQFRKDMQGKKRMIKVQF